MAQPDPIFSQPDDVEIQLAALHLRPRDVYAAVEGGMIGLRRATALHPASTGGFNMWTESNASFAAFALGAGWSREEEKGLTVYTNPSGERFIVTSGDDAVGDLYREPDVRNSKGPMTDASVAPNAAVPLFDPREGLPPVIASATESLWMILYFVRGDMVHTEVSLPRVMDGGRVKQWGPRILLPVLNVPRARFDDDDDFGDTADIPVVPR